MSNSKTHQNGFVSRLIAFWAVNSHENWTHESYSENGHNDWKKGENIEGSNKCRPEQSSDATHFFGGKYFFKIIKLEKI